MHAPVWDDPIRISQRSLSPRNENLYAILRSCLRYDIMFNRCDRHTDTGP